MNQVNKRATLPVGFPPPPDLGDFNAKTEEEYKAYMKRKLLREQWDNSLVLYRMKEKAGDPEGMRQVLARISNQIKVADLNSERTEHSDGPSKKTVYGSEDESKSGLEVSSGVQAGVAASSGITSLVQALHEEQPPSEYEDSQIEDTSNSRAVSHNVNDQDGTSATLKVQPGPPLPKRDHTIPVTVSNEAENKKEENPDGTFQNISNSWTQSTVYNTALAPGRRRYLFIPSQVFLIVMIIISTAVSNVAAGIFCGIIFGIVPAALSGWIIWPCKSMNIFYVMGFYGGEFIAVLLGIIGGFALNRNYFFYVGIPGIIICIVATIIGYLALFSLGEAAQLTDKEESEIF